MLSKYLSPIWKCSYKKKLYKSQHKYTQRRSVSSDSFLVTSYHIQRKFTTHRPTCR